jgi:hypothetical protein
MKASRHAPAQPIQTAATRLRLKRAKDIETSHQ